MLILLSVALAAPMHGFVTGGVGLPELVHVEGGWMATPRLDFGLRADLTLFSPCVGLQVDGLLFGEATDRPPKHALLLSADLMFNPTNRPFSFTTHGESLGGYVGTYAGYAYTAPSGFLLRVYGGALFTDEGGLSGGPNAAISVGWGG